MGCFTKHSYIVLVFAAIGFSASAFSQPNLPKQDIVFASDRPVKHAVFKITEADTVFYDLKIAFDRNNSPKFYYSKLITPVCESGVCYLVAIVIYWDLTATYLTYDLAGDRILTKIDHKHFDKADYTKLDRILGDLNWPLGDYPVDELVVKESKILVDSKVDGYTAATAPFVREQDNIKGALYTIYTLWQFVHDDAIKNDIKNYSQVLANDGAIQLKSLLESERPSYWVWAVEQLLAQQKRDELQASLLNVLSKCDSYLGFEVLKCIDASAPAVQTRLWEIFKASPIEKKQDIEECLRKYKLDETVRVSMSAYMQTVKNPLERMLVKKMIDRS